jgi:hypothetical protein
MNDNNEIQRVRVNRNIWKSSLTKEILHLEDNLDQIYYTASLKPHRIVREEEDDESTMITDEKGITQPELHDYESIIDRQVCEINSAANNICALISSVTEFELPIPALVLLRLANRVGSIRCTDFKKKVPGTLAKKYIYTKRSLDLISTSLTMYEWISTILSTNILPFQQFINENLFSLLAWTRASNLRDYNSEIYYTVRMQTIGVITKMVEHLSLNLNLDSKQLTTLIEEELIGGLDETIVVPEDRIENRYACEVLQCLDRLFIVYANFLDAKLELKLKDFVIRACIKIYRAFEQNVVPLACRRQLLRFLETISNRPHATSTTELAWHIFELCNKMETDPEIRYLARCSIKNGLAHRPTIVSHYDVHDYFAAGVLAPTEEPQLVLEDKASESGDDEVRPYLDLFVDTLVTTEK